MFEGLLFMTAIASYQCIWSQVCQTRQTPLFKKKKKKKEIGDEDLKTTNMPVI